MELSPIALNLADMGLGTTDSPRANMLHASTLYNDYYQDAEPDRYKRDGLPPPLLLETGLIFESMLEEGLRRRFASAPNSMEQIERPGEMYFSDVFEGHQIEIAYNPDLFIYNGVLRIGEIKATWLSSKIPHEWIESEEAVENFRGEIQEAFTNEKLEKYWTQLKFYCYMMRTNYGRLYPCFIAGNYTRPFTTQLIPVDVEFSDEELEMEYYMLIRHGISKGIIQ